MRAYLVLLGQLNTPRHSQACLLDSHFFGRECQQSAKCKLEVGTNSKLNLYCCPSKQQATRLNHFFYDFSLFFVQLLACQCWGFCPVLDLHPCVAAFHLCLKLSRRNWTPTVTAPVPHFITSSKWKKVGKVEQCGAQLLVHPCVFGKFPCNHCTGAVFELSITYQSQESQQET